MLFGGPCLNPRKTCSNRRQHVASQIQTQYAKRRCDILKRSNLPTKTSMVSEWCCGYYAPSWNQLCTHHTSYPKHCIVISNLKLPLHMACDCTKRQQTHIFPFLKSRCPESKINKLHWRGGSLPWTSLELIFEFLKQTVPHVFKRENVERCIFIETSAY